MRNLLSTIDLNVITLPLLMFIFGGCTSYDYGYRSSPDTAPSSRSTSTRSAASSRLSTELARMKADFRQVLESQQRLAGHIEDINERLRAVRIDVRELQKSYSAGDSRKRQSVDALQQRVQQLQNKLAAEQQAREAADQEIIRSVSSEVSAMINRGGGGSSAAGGLQARGTYTVKRGDTLSAIAQAFNVSLKNLKRINGLENDMIREGQKLSIPEE